MNSPESPKKSPKTGSGNLAASDSSRSLEYAIRDPESAIFDSSAARDADKFGFCGSLAVCLSVLLPVTALGAGLWSEMGCGFECYDFLQTKSGHVMITSGSALGILLVLYLLDFFAPPHLPGCFLVLWAEDPGIGKFLLGVAVLGLLTSCYFSARFFPSAPLLITIFLSPVLLMAVRQVTKPQNRFAIHEHLRSGSGLGSPRGSPRSGGPSLEDRLALLKALTGEEQEQRRFFKAATLAFFICGLLAIGAWMPWAMLREVQFESSLDAIGRELFFVRWAAPLVVGASNFIFASFTGLRVALDKSYANTNNTRADILVSSRSSMNRELMDHRIAILKSQLVSTESPESIVEKSRDRAQKYLVQHTAHMRQLSNIVKTVGCCFIALIGALWIAFQFTAADGHIADMIQCFLAAFFLTFVGFIFFSFRRIWEAMSDWLKDLPLWKSAAGIAEADWAKSGVLCFSLPFLPLWLLLSCTNQAVRHCRGLVNADRDSEIKGNSRMQCLTERVSDAILAAGSWDWIRVLSWGYIMALVMMLYKVIPLFLNVLLASMNSMVAQFHFVGILCFTFLAGLFLFMLPPVPGPPIYIFAGMVVAEHCPLGYWWGCVISILVCIVLKLFACAVQQKLVGERLGSRDDIRMAVGVHRPFMRAVETVLRRPGLSFGKCMILCGAPDWPVSVLAGILRLSLAQCMIGTLPVITSVIPMSLTGSFYLRRHESEIWVRAGNLMFATTAVVSITFWAGMGWSIQDEFDKNHEELTAPKEEFVHLDWLDYRGGRIRESCRLSWDDLPPWLQLVHPIGAFLMAGAGHLIFWRTALCFGTFKVTDDVRELRLFGPPTPGGTLIFLPGMIGLVFIAAACACLLASRQWRARYFRRKSAETLASLADAESSWKAQRSIEAQNWMPRRSPALQTAIPLEALSLPAVIGEQSEKGWTVTLSEGSDGFDSVLAFEPDMQCSASSSPVQGKQYTVAAELSLQMPKQSIGRPVWLQDCQEPQSSPKAANSVSKHRWLSGSPGANSWIGDCGCNGAGHSPRSEL